MRHDGRKADELRSISITPNFSSFAEGSVLISFGKTQLLCNLTIENTVPRWMQIANKPGGWVTAEYAMLPRSTIIRTPREVNGATGRTQEIRRLIGRCLRSAVNLEKLGTRTLIIDCDVIQADGSTRTVAITGGYLAMAIGLNRLVKTGEIPEDVITRCVASVSVGIIDQKVVLDLDYFEDSQADVDVNIVMNNHGEFVEIQASAEHKAFRQNQLDEILKLARQGIDHLISIQNKYINETS